MEDYVSMVYTMVRYEFHSVFRTLVWKVSLGAIHCTEDYSGADFL